MEKVYSDTSKIAKYEAACDDMNYGTLPSQMASQISIMGSQGLFRRVKGCQVVRHVIFGFPCISTDVLPFIR